MKARLLAGICLIALTIFHPLSSPAGRPFAATEETEPAGTSSGKMRAIPFHGIIASFDDKARTFTIAGKENARSFKITETTVITKGGQPATMKDIVANEEVRGSYYKMGDGSLEAKTVKLGSLTEAEKAEKETRKEKREARKAEASPSSTP